MPNRGNHAMRYTAAVRLLELGFAYEDVAEHLGHSTARMARTYCQKRRAAELRARHLVEGPAMQQVVSAWGGGGRIGHECSWFCSAHPPAIRRCCTAAPVFLKPSAY